MRMKKDYMGNDQLLPAYNIQIGVADEYIAVAEVMQHRSDTSIWQKKTYPDITASRLSGVYSVFVSIFSPVYASDIQIGVADEYIAVAEVMQHRSDMDCFVPLMKKFYGIYGFYPRYPIADAGYGSFNKDHCDNFYPLFPSYT